MVFTTAYSAMIVLLLWIYIKNNIMLVYLCMSNECTYLEECVHSSDVRLTVFDGEMAEMEVRELGHHKVNLCR